jgi:hypothetical protein
MRGAHEGRGERGAGKAVAAAGGGNNNSEQRQQRVGRICPACKPPRRPLSGPIFQPELSCYVCIRCKIPTCCHCPSGPSFQTMTRWSKLAEASRAP